MKLRPDEYKLCGSWILVGSSLVIDDVGKRIEELTSKYLTKLKTDPSGWNTLYQDSIDNRYWELIYPESELQGGGASTLQYITEEEAKNKYQYSISSE